MLENNFKMGDQFIPYFYYWEHTHTHTHNLEGSHPMDDACPEESHNHVIIVRHVEGRQLHTYVLICFVLS